MVVIPGRSGATEPGIDNHDRFNIAPFVFIDLTLAQQKAEAEDIRCKAIDGGIAVPDISRATYGEKG